MKVRLRNARKKDCLQVARILTESYTSLGSNSKKAIRAFKSECSRGYHYIIAERESKSDKEIIGLCAWFYHGLPKHGLIEIDRFAVKKEYRKKGIGKKLFLFLIKESNTFFKKHKFKLRKIFLSTREKNFSARKFYLALGFKKEGLLKNHFYKNKNDILYSYFVHKKQ